jgi:hypothetical protein
LLAKEACLFEAIFININKQNNKNEARAKELKNKNATSPSCATRKGSNFCFLIKNKKCSLCASPKGRRTEEARGAEGGSTRSTARENKQNPKNEARARGRRAGGAKVKKQK